MTTTNYGIVIVFNRDRDRGAQRHYTEVRTYAYLADANEDMKFDAVEVYKDAEYKLRQFDDDKTLDKPRYHLEVVKLRWSGNYSEIAKSYTNWPN